MLAEVGFDYLAGGGGDEEIEFFVEKEVAAERAELPLEDSFCDAVLAEAVSARQQNRSYQYFETY